MCLNTISYYKNTNLVHEVDKYMLLLDVSTAEQVYSLDKSLYLIRCLTLILIVQTISYIYGVTYCVMKLAALVS